MELPTQKTAVCTENRFSQGQVIDSQSLYKILSLLHGQRSLKKNSYKTEHETRRLRVVKIRPSLVDYWYDN